MLRDAIDNSLNYEVQRAMFRDIGLSTDEIQNTIEGTFTMVEIRMSDVSTSISAASRTISRGMNDLVYTAIVEMEAGDADGH